ncbi:MAG: GFA family protein [Gammaproteobacteria bacterium]
MMETHEGGCVCGAVRYRVKNNPVRTSVCHCTFCQRRTGSAFGIGAYFMEEDIEMIRGALKTYEHRSDESQRWLRMQFCTQCGTTVTWTAEALPGIRAIAGGTFDQPAWFRIERHSWMRSAHAWLAPPTDVEVFQESSLKTTHRTG